MKKLLWTVWVGLCLAGVSMAAGAAPVAGQVWTWGSSVGGESGSSTYIATPVPTEVAGMADVIAIKGGNSHSLALKADGAVWAWGQNYAGALGDGTFYSFANRGPNPPRQVKHPADPSGHLTGVIAIAAGYKHSMALKADGTVWTWGSNVAGELGDGTFDEKYTPVQVSGLGSVIAISSTDQFGLALKADGTVWAWGWNSNGQLGNGTVYGYSSVPVQVKDSNDPTGNLTGVTALATGYYHSLALKADGTVWAWGAGYYGQLGNNTTQSYSNQLTPVQVIDPGDPSGKLTGVVSVAAYYEHSLAVKADGTVWAWGNNYYGQLGDGTTVNRFTPVQVSGLSGAITIGAGGAHSLALKADGTAWAWGVNYDGVLGDGTTINRLTPVQVIGMGCVTALEGGGSHSLAIASTAPCTGNHPPLANAGPDQTVTASSAAGASVMLDGTASSDADGDALTYTWSGAFGAATGINPVVTLPLGANTITLTVSDGHTSATDTVVINVRYAFGGFLPPLTAGSRTTFRLGSVIPVKFHLSYASGASATSAIARITLQQYSGSDPVGVAVEGVSVSSADSGNLFRLNGDTYSFNLATKLLSAGIYAIQAVLDDGTTQSIEIGLTSK